MFDLSTKLTKWTDWLEKDIDKVDRELQETWSKTDMGRRGIKREDVNPICRWIEIAKAAHAGRYN